MSDRRRQELRVPGLAKPISHYTDAVRFGDLLLVSGCAPLDATGALVGTSDVVRQARQVLTNLSLVLRAADASFADVLKVTVYMLDITARTEVDEVRREFFGTARPASTLIEVSRLAIPGMLIEIDAIAGLPA
jgi:2-iminobutanoate/2-iminopropanoate deaminase